jgi:hypothetical protein
MEIYSRTAELTVENRAPQAAVLTILALSLKKVNQKHAVF